MKKILLSALVCSALFASNSHAQLADGSIAPDFTVSDINGTQHNLYTYLDQGYSVVMDVSATWCGPCWSYHQSGALEDLYVNHGPAGFPGVSPNTTDDVMVLWFEGDGSTTQADLEGTGGNTQGNWLAGTAFPIIDDASVNGPFEIAFYPTIYTICPDRIATVSGQLSAANHYTGIGDCPSQFQGADAGLIGYNGDAALCGAGEVPVTVDLQNLGTDDLVSAEIMVYDGATLLSTTNWTGNLTSWAFETVDCGSVSVSGATTLDITVSLANDGVATNNTIEKVVNVAPLGSLDITVNVFTDVYALETSWAIKSSTGATVASGGPYAEGTDDNFGAGGPDALTTMVHEVTLPAGEDCYSFELYDSYGDGLQYGDNPAGQFGWEIVSNGAVLSSVSAGNFGTELVTGAVLRTDAGSGLMNLDMANISVYPNPASEVVNISMEGVSSEASVSIMDLQGRILATQSATSTNGTQVITFATEGFAKGTYVVSVRTNGLTSNTNVVIK
jgi:hypothetical protein